MLKWILILVGALAALAALVFVAGSILPVKHSATIRARYGRPAPEVFDAITNLDRVTEWREDLERIERLSPPGEEPQRWREFGSFGPMTYEREVWDPPRRAVVRIADTSQGFGGKWTYVVEPDGEGSTLTITEDGEVYNALFRFMSRFIFGHHSTMLGMARSLGRSFGEETVPEKVGG